MKVGVVGLGYWGPNLVRNFSENHRCGGVVCCDKDPAKLAGILRRYPHIETTSDFTSLLSDPTIEAIAIATPVGTHYELAKAALESGKHVFVEKPLTSDSRQAEDLIRRAEAVGRTLMVGHTFEFSPPVLRVKELLDSGDLGEVRYITSSRVNLGLHQADVSVIWDLAAHDFSILFFWLGQEPKRIIAMGRDFVQRGIPDMAFITLDFPSGVMANVLVSWLSPSKLRRTAIIASRKMVVYDDTESYEKVKIFDSGVDFRDPETFGEYQLSYRTGDIISPRLDTYEPLSREIDHFLECAETGARPRTDGHSGLRVVRALEAADASLRSGGAMQEL